MVLLIFFIRKCPRISKFHDGCCPASRHSGLQQSARPHIRVSVGDEKLVSYGDSNVWPRGLLQATVLAGVKFHWTSPNCTCHNWLGDQYFWNTDDMINKHIEDRTMWLPFCRWHFKYICMHKNSGRWYFDYNFTHVSMASCKTAVIPVR